VQHLDLVAGGGTTVSGAAIANSAVPATCMATAATPRRPQPGATALTTTKLIIGRPDLVEHRGLGRRHPSVVRLPLHLTATHRDTVIDAINHYLLNPAARPALGTPTHGPGTS